MAAAVKVAGTDVQASVVGLDMYAVQIELADTETDEVTVDTGFRSVVNVQVTWVDALGSANTLVATPSGGVITVKATGAVVGANKKVSLLALGYRG